MQLSDLERSRFRLSRRERVVRETNGVNETLVVDFSTGHAALQIRAGRRRGRLAHPDVRAAHLERMLADAGFPRSCAYGDFTARPEAPRRPSPAGGDGMTAPHSSRRRRRRLLDRGETGAALRTRPGSRRPRRRAPRRRRSTSRASVPATTSRTSSIVATSRRPLARVRRARSGVRRRRLRARRRCSPTPQRAARAALERNRAEPARRDKHEMAQALRRAGLRAVAGTEDGERRGGRGLGARPRRLAGGRQAARQRRHRRRRRSAQTTTRSAPPSPHVRTSERAPAAKRRAARAGAAARHAAVRATRQLGWRPPRLRGVARHQAARRRAPRLRLRGTARRATDEQQDHVVPVRGRGARRAWDPLRPRATPR